MKRPIDSRFYLGMALVFVMTVGNSLLAFRYTRLLYQTADGVTHAHDVLDALADLLSTAKDAETGQRGFVITGSDEYLRPYHAAEGSFAQRLRTIDSLSRDNPEQRIQVLALRRAVDATRDDLRQTIQLRLDGGFAAAETAMRQGSGKAAMDSLRSQVQRMIADEQQILRVRTAAAEHSRNAAVTTILLAGALEVLTLAAMLYLLRRKIRNREQAAARLEEQKEWFRTTLASVGDAVITTDIDGKVTFLNAVAEHLTGWLSANALGQPLDAVFNAVYEDSRRPVMNPALRALREGLTVGLANHAILISRDGTERPIDDSAAQIRTDDNRVIGAVLVFRDITERRNAEAQLRDADQRKDEFLAVLAHELRNPLAPLRNALEILRLSHQDPATTEQVGGIMERQLQHMVRLIDDLLDVSRITGNRLDLRREPVDIAGVVHSALETCGPLLHESGHVLKLTLPPHPVHVDADRARLSQAIGNLLGNAIKYTESGGRIWLAVVRDGTEVIITVRDTGIGIPAGMLESIFEMFVQVDSSLERSRAGLGIGLPLVKRIIEMHGGSVRAESAGLGRGSEFIVRLPVVLAPARTVPDAAIPRLPIHKRRILIADDNLDAARSLGMMLEMMGHEIRTTHDGLEAIAEGAQFKPDVALLDIGMPRLNGYEAARKIRASDWGRDIILVALTGWGQTEDRRRSGEAGFDHHMVKPVELAALESVLNDRR
jgi:PAS domain S-box-containing protein